MRFAISGSSFVTRGAGADPRLDHLPLQAPLRVREPGPGDAWGPGHEPDDELEPTEATGQSAIDLLASAVGRALEQARLPRDGLRWAVIVSADLHGPVPADPPGTDDEGGIDPPNLEALLNEALRSAVPVLTIHGAGGAASAIALAEDFLASGVFDAVVSAATGSQEPTPADPAPPGTRRAGPGASALVVESFSQASRRGSARWMLPREAHGSWQRCPDEATDEGDPSTAPRPTAGPELRRLPVRTRTRPVQSPTSDRRSSTREDRRSHGTREKAWRTSRSSEGTAGMGPPEVHITLSNWDIPSLAQHKLLWPALMDAANHGPAVPLPGAPAAPPTASDDDAPALQLAGRVLQPLLVPLGLPTQLDRETVCGVIVAANACTDSDVAAALVRRYHLGPMSLNVASGSAASSDALAVAANAIRSGRAQRVLVLSVELDPANRRPARPRTDCTADAAPAAAMEGAAAVLLESADSRDQRGGTSLGRIAHCLFLHADSTDHRLLTELIERHADKTFYLGGDSFLRLALTALLDERRTRSVDFGDAAQRAHGLTGLLQLVAHCERRGAGADGQGAVIIGGGGGHDRRAVLLVIEPD